MSSKKSSPVGTYSEAQQHQLNTETLPDTDYLFKAFFLNTERGEQRFTLNANQFCEQKAKTETVHSSLKSFLDIK